MIACRLFEHYLSAPTPPPPPPPPPSVFLWLSAVRVHTHPWAKESKIDHTSNWSRCTGTGSSSRADLSHAGKIMHPELTAQHTRLPSTSFLKHSRNFPIGRKKQKKKKINNTRGETWRFGSDSAANGFPNALRIEVRRLRVTRTYACRADLTSVSGFSGGGSFIVSCGLLAMA